MTTVNLFTRPVFKEGALTANDPDVRRFALAKALDAIDLGAELGADIFVLWGGREGTEAHAAKPVAEALDRYAEAINAMTAYIAERGYKTCASRSNPSPTSRAATSCCRRSVTRWPSSRASTHPNSSA